MRISISFLFFNFFLISSQSHAEIGSLQEIINQTNNNQTNLIEEILGALNSKLASFVKSENISQSPEKKLAWALTVTSLLKTLRVSAESASSRASWVRASDDFNTLLSYYFKTPLYAASQAAHNAIKELAEEAEITVSLNAAIEIFLLSGTQRKVIALTEQALVPTKNISAQSVIAYNIAQWALLNNILDNFESTLPVVYERTLRFVQTQPQDEKHIHLGICGQNNKYFQHLNRPELSFLSGWFLLSSCD